MFSQKIVRAIAIMLSCSAMACGEGSGSITTEVPLSPKGTSASAVPGSSHSQAKHSDTGGSSGTQATPAQSTPPESAAVPPEPEQGSQGRVCRVTRASQIPGCVARLRWGLASVLEIAALIPCNASSACRINLTGLRNKVIRGKGWKTGFSRSAGYQQPIIEAPLRSKPHNITISDMWIHEGGGQAELPIGSWAAPVKLMGGSQLRVERVKITHAPDVALWVNNVDGFTLTDSEVRAAAHLGVVVGESGLPLAAGWGPSNNVVIRRNVFVDVATNALALHGVRGKTYGENVIEDNTFTNNHRNGRYLGGLGIKDNVLGGGMIYLRDARYLTLQRNVLEHGYCGNCMLLSPEPRDFNQVRGLELDGTRTEDGVRKVVEHLRVVDNLFFNLSTDAIFHNYGWADTGPLADMVIKGNRFWLNGTALPASGTVGALHGSRIEVRDNDVKDAALSYSWESDDEWHPGRWNSWGLCKDWSVSRYCADDAMDGRCTLRLTSGPNCQQVCTQSQPVPLSPGKWVLLSDWARNGQYRGANAIVFLDASYGEIVHESVALRADSWSFNGEPLVRAKAPPGTAYFAARFCLYDPNGTIDHDYSRAAY